jgi:hypothetical protein
MYLAEYVQDSVIKKNPPEIAERSQKVIENKGVKNAGFRALHYVNENTGVRAVSPLY